MMRMRDEGEGDDKIIAVHVHDPSFNHYRDIKELPQHQFKEIERFFQDYKALEEKSVEVDSFKGSVDALEAVIESFKMYRREENRLRGW
jgi:inorganic pyrophosphatase